MKCEIPLWKHFILKERFLFSFVDFLRDYSELIIHILMFGDDECMNIFYMHSLSCAQKCQAHVMPFPFHNEFIRKNVITPE